MRILVYLCYRGYSIQGTFSALNKPLSSTNFLQDILEKAILRFCPARRPKILLSTYTECNVHSLCNTAVRISSLNIHPSCLFFFLNRRSISNYLENKK
jgi:hypothetical protein